MDKDVPYIVHEGDMARMERSNRRLWIIVLVLIDELVTATMVYNPKLYRAFMRKLTNK